MRAPGREGEIIDVLIEYDGPQCFIMKDDTGQIEIGLHTIATQGSDNWLYASITSEQATDARSGHASLRAIFDNPEDGWYVLVRLSDEGDVRIERFTKDNLDSRLLPDAPNAPLVSIAPFDEQVAVMRTNRTPSLPDLGESSAIPTALRSPTAMWEASADALDYLKSIKTPTYVAATRSRRFVCDLLLNPGSGRFDTSVAGLGSLLTVTQKLFDSLALSPQLTPQRGPLPTKSATRLSAVATFPSSFALRMQSHEASLLPTTEITSAAHKFISLVRSGDNVDLLKATLDSCGRRAASYYSAFISSLAKLEAEFGFDAGFPGEHVSESASLTLQQLTTIRQFFGRNLEFFDQEGAFTGRLVAVNLPAKFFRLESDDGEAISGRISDDALAQVTDKRINALHHAQVITRVEFDEISGVEKVKNTLLALEEADSPNP